MPEPKSALNDTSGSEREPPGSSRSSLVSDGTRRSPARKPHRLLHHRKERQPHPRAALREGQNGNPEAPAAAGARRSKAPGKDCRILPEVRPVHHPQPVPALWILHDEAEDRQTGEAVCSSLCPAAALPKAPARDFLFQIRDLISVPADKTGDSRRGMERIFRSGSPLYCCPMSLAIMLLS